MYRICFMYLLAATPPSGRLFLLVPAESFFEPSALIIKFKLSYDRFAVTPQLLINYQSAITLRNNIWFHYDQFSFNLNS